MTTSTLTASRVSTEDDPTPMVRLLARTLRSSARDVELGGVLAGLTGVVAVRADADPQAATICFGDGKAHVTHGVGEHVTATLAVDLHDALAVRSVDGEKDAPVTVGARQLLAPPLPDWREAAEEFWDLTSGDPGMPDRLVLVCTDDGAGAVLGSGPTECELSGSAERLARVLSGVDFLLYEVFDQNLTFRGTVSLLSVMIGASWKVRFDA